MLNTFSRDCIEDVISIQTDCSIVRKVVSNEVFLKTVTIVCGEIVSASVSVGKVVYRCREGLVPLDADSIG